MGRIKCAALSVLSVHQVQRDCPARLHGSHPQRGRLKLQWWEYQRLTSHRMHAQSAKVVESRGCTQGLSPIEGDGVLSSLVWPGVFPETGLDGKGAWSFATRIETLQTIWTLSVCRGRRNAAFVQHLLDMFVRRSGACGVLVQLEGKQGGDHRWQRGEVDDNVVKPMQCVQGRGHVAHGVVGQCCEVDEDVDHS